MKRLMFNKATTKIRTLLIIYINIVCGANRLWGKSSANRLWGESSLGRDVRGAKRPWGEMSLGRKVHKPSSKVRAVRAAAAHTRK